MYGLLLLATLAADPAPAAAAPSATANGITVGAPAGFVASKDGTTFIFSSPGKDAQMSIDFGKKDQAVDAQPDGGPQAGGPAPAGQDGPLVVQVGQVGAEFGGAHGPGQRVVRRNDRRDVAQPGQRPRPLPGGAQVQPVHPVEPGDPAANFSRADASQRSSLVIAPMRFAISSSDGADTIDSTTVSCRCSGPGSTDCECRRKRSPSRARFASASSDHDASSSASRTASAIAFGMK